MIKINENVKTKLKVLVIVLSLFISGVLFFKFFNVPFHETGHMIACKLIGGNITGYEIIVERTGEVYGGRIICEYYGDELKSKILLISGFMFELIIVTILISLLPISAIGSAYSFKISYWLLNNAYEHDFSGLGIEYLTIPLSILLFIMGIIGIILNFYYVNRSIKH